MATDQCITVNEADEVLGYASKYDVHRFNDSQPKGVLHRAFSVFLFNEDNKLLLQQRAAGKITFPNVWTNTCCSHPLFGQWNDEVDDANAAAAGLAQVCPFSCMTYRVITAFCKLVPFLLWTTRDLFAAIRYKSHYASKCC